MKRLIINADDLGYDPAVTRGILKAMREGVVTSATFMVNTPFSEAAAAEARGLALGLHLNLARHSPVSKAIPPSLLSEGRFDERRAGELRAEVVEQETLAQLDRLEALTGAKATHVDVHKHLHTHPEILSGLCAAARKRDLPVRSISAEMRTTLHVREVRTTDHFTGDAGAQAYWSFDQLVANAAEIADGVTEWMCHPGYAPTETKSGYAEQREVELATFTDPRVREELTRAGAVLVDFRILRSS